MSFGIIYLVKNSFMPYHSDALGVTWNELDAPTRYLVLALMRATSGGFIASAFAMFFLQLKFTSSKLHWIPWVIVILGTILSSCLVYATSMIDYQYSGRPPLAEVIAGELLLIVGFIFNNKFLAKT